MDLGIPQSNKNAIILYQVGLMKFLIDHMAEKLMVLEKFLKN